MELGFSPSASQTNLDIGAGTRNLSDAKFKDAEGKIDAAVKARDIEGAAEAAQDFEAVFISEMLSHMDTQEPDPLFGGGQAEATYKGMMNEEYGKQIARAGGIGLADHIKAQMIAMQEMANGKAHQ